MRNDDEQLESLKSWWEDNGKSLLAGVLIALVGVGGWKGWSAYQESQALSAADLYGQLIHVLSSELTDSRQQQADTLIQQLITEFDASVYADYARLFAARLAVERDELDAAQSYLQEAMQQTRVDAIERVARLRLARILYSSQQLDAALTLLDIEDTGGFEADYQALRGDILMDQGHILQAQEAYQRALDASQLSGDPAPLVEMKLDNLPARRGDV